MVSGPAGYEIEMSLIEDCTDALRLQAQAGSASPVLYMLLLHTGAPGLLTGEAGGRVKSVQRE